MKGLLAFPGLFRLYLFTSKLDISRNMAYRFDFIVGTIISLGYSCVAPIVQYLIYTTTNGYPGWTVQELLLFQGVLLFWNGLRVMMFGKVFGETMSMVRTGDFDRLLVKPYSPIGIMLSNGFQLNGLAPTLAGIVIISVAAARLDIVWHWWTIPAFLLFVGFGLLLYISFLIIMCTIVIMTVQVSRMNEVFDKIVAFSEYPLSIYPRGAKMLVAFIFPLALWVNYPAQALLDRLEPAMIWGVLLSIVVLYITSWIWKLCLHKYQSAGG